VVAAAPVADLTAAVATGAQEAARAALGPRAAVETAVADLTAEWAPPARASEPARAPDSAMEIRSVWVRSCYLATCRRPPGM
jgi:hypothetical protein